jgi:hypothetical protein
MTTGELPKEIDPSLSREDAAEVDAAIAFAAGVTAVHPPAEREPALTAEEEEILETSRTLSIETSRHDLKTVIFPTRQE